MRTIFKVGIVACSLIFSSGAAQFALAQQQTPAQAPSTTAPDTQAAPTQHGPAMGDKTKQQGMDHGRMGMEKGHQMDGKEHGHSAQSTTDQNAGTSTPARK